MNALRKKLEESEGRVVCVEFGAYCGYSGILMASEFQKFAVAFPGKVEPVLFSCDPSPVAGAVAARLILHAGVQNYVKQVYKKSSDFIEELAVEGTKIDFLFLDHLKDLYLPDLQKVMELKLLNPGAVIVADNCKYPGTPDYNHFVLNHPKLKTVVNETFLEYSQTIEDQVLVSQYSEK